VKNVVLKNPPAVPISLIADRKRHGLDTHDEVWNGEYHMAPAASFNHSRTILRLIQLLAAAGDRVGLEPSVEFNLGDSTNFGVPDFGLHRGSPSGVWLDTAAVVGEVRSPNDETFERFNFYFEHGIEEILVADLTTTTVTWFLRTGSGFVESNKSALTKLTTSEIVAALDWE
jgi:Putative restriction endonuclease